MIWIRLRVRFAVPRADRLFIMESWNTSLTFNRFKRRSSITWLLKIAETFDMKVSWSWRLSFAKPWGRRAGIQSGVRSSRRSEHQRAVPWYCHASVAGGARPSVDDDGPVVLRPVDVRDDRVGVGRAVDATRQLADEVDVSGLGEDVRQICSCRRRDQQQHTNTSDRHYCLCFLSSVATAPTRTRLSSTLRVLSREAIQVALVTSTSMSRLQLH